MVTNNPDHLAIGIAKAHLSLLAGYIQKSNTVERDPLPNSDISYFPFAS